MTQVMEKKEKAEGSVRLVSGSTQVLEYLRSLPAGTEFSSQSIQKALGDKISSSGVVTGFLAKLKADGKITVTSQGRSHSGAPINLYSAVDLDSAVTQNRRSPGGKTGRQFVGVARKTKLVEMLLAVASQLESLRGDLSDFSTRELLHELEKRTK